MVEEEKPIVHMDHRLYHDEPRVELDVYDLGDIPKEVKLSVHRMKGFDDILKEFRRPPSKWLNHWAKLDHRVEPVPVLFDMDGHAYIMVPAKHQETAPLLDAIVAGLKGTKPIVVKLYIRDENFGEMLDRMETATDFCDYCGYPLHEHCNDWLEHDGESIADVYDCDKEGCESESIRWDTEFLKWHPILEGLGLKTR